VEKMVSVPVITLAIIEYFLVPVKNILLFLVIANIVFLAY
jgi:hypothetical protein